MKTKLLHKPFIFSVPLLLLAACLSLAVHAATLNTQLDRSKVSLGDTVTLTIELPSDSSVQPDLSPLREDFDIPGTGSSSRTQIINGQTSHSNQLNVTLVPHRTGNITIPALKFGSDETQPLQLSVSDAPLADSSRAGSPVWVEMETALADDNHEVSVQQEIPLTVRLYTAIPLHNVSLNPPAPAGATVEKLDQDKQYQTERDGQTYQVVEQHYAVFPEQPGELNIPPVTLQAVTPDPDQQQRGAFRSSPFNDDFFRDAFKNSPLAGKMLSDDFFNGPFGMTNGGKPVNLRSNGLAFSVAHIPQAAQGSSWLPARNITLTGSWQDTPPELRSGEPATLTLTVTADGLTGAQIPAIKLPQIAGVRVYSEPLQADSRTNGEQVTGISTQTFTLIPERSGKLELPAISLPWWNTRTRSMQTAELPGRTLNVAPGSGAAMSKPATTSATATPDTEPSAPPPAPGNNHAARQSNGQANSQSSWLPAAGGVILLVLLAAAGWYGYRRRHHNTPDTNSPVPPSAAAQIPFMDNRTTLNTARDQFEQACTANDPYLSARTLLEWAQQVWPHKAPASLPELAQRAEGAAATEIRALHQYLYQPGKPGNWSGAALAKALHRGLKADTADHKQRSKTDDQSLPPLYPA